MVLSVRHGLNVVVYCSRRRGPPYILAIYVTMETACKADGVSQEASECGLLLFRKTSNFLRDAVRVGGAIRECCCARELPVMMEVRSEDQL